MFHISLACKAAKLGKNFFFFQSHQIFFLFWSLIFTVYFNDMALSGHSTTWIQVTETFQKIIVVNFSQIFIMMYDIPKDEAP